MSQYETRPSFLFDAQKNRTKRTKSTMVFNQQLSFRDTDCTSSRTACSVSPPSFGAEPKSQLQLRFAREAVFGHVARSGRQLFAKQPLQPCVALIWRTQLCPHLVHGHVRELHVLELWLCQQPTLQGQPNSSSWGRHFASVDELSSSGTGSKLQMPCEQPTSAQCLLISNSSTGHVVGIECQEMWMPLEGRPL